jgi:alpha-1,2-mannosyltransferase
MESGEAQVTLWDPLNAVPRARCWLWAGLAVLVCVFQGPTFVSTLRPARTRVVDFFRNWAAARFVVEGLPAYSEQYDAMESYSGDPYATRSEYFQIPRLTHPPVTVLAALPFAGLDYPNATLAWNLFSLGCLGVSLWLIGRGLEIPFTSWAMFPLVTLLVICHPLREQQLNGQLNLVLLLLIVGTWTLDRADRQAGAGALLGIATALKLFPAFLLVYFLVRRRWMVVFTTLATFGLLTELSVLVLGLEAYRTYFDEVVPHLEGCRGFAYNASLPGFWSKLFDPGEALVKAWIYSQSAARAATLVSGMAVTVIVMWLAWRVGRVSKSSHDSRAAFDQNFGATVTAMLLVTPTVWHHYFLLLALPLALIWKWLPPTAFARGLFMLVCVLFWFHPMLWWKAFVADGFPGGYATPLLLVTVVGLQTYALLGLFGMGIVATLMQTQPTAHGTELDTAALKS